MNCTIKQLKLVIDINNVLGSVPFLEHYLCDEEKCEIKKLNEYIRTIETQNILMSNIDTSLSIFKHITFIYEKDDKKDEKIICVYNKDVNYNSNGVNIKGIIYI